MSDEASSAAQPKPRSKSWLKLAAAIWLLLLIASHLLWSEESPSERITPSDLTVELRAVVGETLETEPVLLAYRDRGANAQAARSTLVLLHGSPGSIQDFDKLAEQLPDSLRVLVPDLPGFGSSQRAIPDYSSRAHAHYLLQWLDELQVESAHLVAFSMGGAVAAEFAELAPERVASISMVAALGVEELELFGDHQLNHLVHEAQLRGIQFLRLAVPHFGGADDWVLGKSYARNFYDTDQRRVRPALNHYDGPMLVVHGDADFLVPVAAALETHRIVPQSELVLLDSSHFILWKMTAEVARLLSEFVERVELGEATTRASADPERVAHAAQTFDPSSVPPAMGPTLLVLIALLIIGTLISEDLTCIAAGIMVAQGRLTFLPALLGCTAGIFIGDVGLFLAGRFFGRPIVRRAPVSWFLSTAALDRAAGWFERQGPRAIFLSRFMPGLRLPTYFAAGVLKTSFPKFVFYFLLAVLVWTPVLVGFAMLFGAEALELLDEWGALALIAFVFALLLIERVVVRLFTFRGRRALVGAWQRVTRWEFWPTFVFYPPVLVYVAWLALKHRSLLLVTAVNPGIPTGGLIGEPKSAILDELDASSGLLAKHLLLRESDAVETRLSAAIEFAAQHGGGYPIIYKPEVGQRGSGVMIVRSEEELRELVSEMRIDHILQEYVSGPEYGLFYLREPGAERGRVYSITEKLMPELVGDGEHTLEQLILLGERTVAAAPHYLRLHAEKLQLVPERGECIVLVDIGTHCRGAVFMNGERLATPELTASLDALSKSFEGFHFGRYDVRAESEQALREGRNFKVLELNGMTSEATHIYEPGTPLLEAYRVLFEQWRLAFEIAAANRAAGAKLSSWREVLRELLSYRSKQRAHGT